jgi:hypothetical protein
VRFAVLGSSEPWRACTLIDVPNGWAIWVVIGALYVLLKVAIIRWVGVRGTLRSSMLLDAPLAILALGASVLLASVLPLALAAAVLGRRYALRLWFLRRASPRRAALVYALLFCLLLLIPFPGLAGTGNYTLIAEWIGGVLLIGVLVYGFISFLLRSLGGEFDPKVVDGDIRRRSP